MFGKRTVAALVAEFLGTGVLTLLVLSVQRSTIGVPFFVASGAGLTVAVMYYVFGPASGGYFNPAIAIALWTARKLSTITTIVFVAAELVAAYGAYRLYEYLVKSKLTAVGGHFTGRTLVAEAVAAGILGFVWAAVSYKKWTANISGAALGIGTMIAMVAASVAGLGLVNPALALGVNAWVWGTYVVGPVIGAVVGVNLFGQVFATKQELTSAGANSAMFAMSTSSAASATKSVSTKKPAAKKKSSSRAKSTRAKK